MKGLKRVLIMLIILPCLFLIVSCGSTTIDDPIPSNPSEDTPSSQTGNISVKVYIDNEITQTLFTSEDQDYKIAIPEKPEDVTTNTNINKYFYGWFTDSSYKTELSEDTKFTSNGAIYAKWIEVYNDRFVYDIENGKANIIGFSFSGLSGGIDIVIPSYINQIPVESISPSAFSSAFSSDSSNFIRTVIICDGVKNIASGAFYNYYYIYFNYVTIQPTTIYLPKTLEKIYVDSFLSYKNIEKIVIDDENTIYGSPEKCNAIIELATDTLLLGCKNTVIPETVKTIGSSAFKNCLGLTSITLPDNITKIEASAFDGCSNLTNITLSNELIDIGNSAFYECSKLTNITLPNKLTTIGNSAFYGCSSFTSLNIPASVSSISNSSFTGCNLDTIEVSDDNVVYASTNNCNAVIEKSTDTLILGCKNTVIPETVKIIGDSAFKNCLELTSMILPNSITKIEDSAFWGCSNLVNLVIPNSVTSIGTKILYDCSSIAQISIPFTGNGSNVTYFGYLFGIGEPNSLYVDDSNIPHSLIKVIITNGTKIENNAFKQCSNLKIITLSETIENIGEFAFYKCSSLKNITIPKSVTSIGDSAFMCCFGLTNITIPEGVTRIGNYVFHSCSELTSIIIPEGITIIGGFAFCYCYKLISIIIPDSVTRIGYSAFYGCSGLDKVYYEGNKSDWKSIEIDDYNSDLADATRYYYIESEADVPTDGGNYWHYDDDNNVVIW